MQANGSPAFAQYHASPDGRPHRAFAIHVLALAEEPRIRRIDCFLTLSAFALFDLPLELDPPGTR